MKYDEFYRKNRTKLVGIAYRILRNRDDAEDTVQNVCLSLLESWKSINILDIDAYSTRMVHNAAVQELRDRVEISELSEEHAPLSSAPDERIITKEFAEQLDKAIAQLPSNQRNALLLKQERGLTYPEIASLMNESETNVRQLISRARRQLASSVKTQ
ncbi:MAG: sigma-70 family RNA polymerase sigma factor [Paludibacteraceae bacterium]|nr:sigma-70 family RNA polymerase sigma factor [Paludibacteraceae bacterium]